ncbi:MAG: sugar ABC transporter ATP-binding protein [Alphaproteobacteria bacterium]
MQNIHMAFGGNVALVDETFQVMPGEIVGLLGHNGAGKSTLVNVATGALRPQRGEMEVDGAAIALRGDPREIERAGIKVIHQEPALADNLSVADNITLGRREESLSPGARQKFASQALALLGSSMDVTQPVSSLEFGEKQIVDLARALSTNLRVLFLDEPTGALGQHEADRLHALLRKLSADGRGIVYVSHRLRDILEVCTRLVVLRGGRIVLDRPARGFGIAELSEALAPGMKAEEGAVAASAATETVLKVVRDEGQALEFRRGEIVGLFGMAAGPQFKLLDALFGIRGGVSAELDGAAYAPGSPRGAIRRGVYYVSANRERDGLLKDMSALDNLVLPWVDHHTSYLAVSHAKAAGVYQLAKDALNVRGGHMDAPISALSGGNRQKIVVGRWLFGKQPRILLLSQPTQGVDVGARLDIARALRKLAAQGVTVLVASSESDEIELICERAYICEGRTWAPSAPGPDWAERLLQGLIQASG